MFKSCGKRGKEASHIIKSLVKLRIPGVALEKTTKISKASILVIFLY